MIQVGTTKKEALKYVSKLVNENKGVKLPTPCVNKEVLKFNRQVKNVMKIRSNVKLLEINIDRKHFTKHGQQLNVCGKEVTSLKLAMVIGQFYKKETISFYLYSMERLLLGWSQF
jgi:TPP-dependent indolepyruvate ferredoxin oxidoreductase alpha subunit